MRAAVACKGKAVAFPPEWGTPRGWPINFKPIAVELSPSFLAADDEDEDEDELRVNAGAGADGGYGYGQSKGRSADAVPWVRPGRELVLVRHAESQLNVLDREDRRRKKKAKQ